MTWEKGRQLKTFDDISYEYNANGIRTAKTVGGVRHEYDLEGSNILRESDALGNVIVPMYDGEEQVCGMTYNGELFFFHKNLQGDIIAITDHTAAVVARYSYDAWGKCTILSDTSGCEIATVNPFRYRGYYYDAETGMYYLQSRYYNPQVGRFLNADGYVSTGTGILGYNMFAYCLNNPVNGYDPCGTCFHRWDFWNDCDSCGGRTLGDKCNDFLNWVGDLDIAITTGYYVSLNTGIWNISGSCNCFFR